MSQINGLIEMLEKEPQEDSSANKSNKTRIITVVSGKGGVGKSNITVNLAILYGLIGKKVLVMDADLGLANINVLLGIVPRYTLLDLVKGNKKLKEILISYNKNVDLIPGATGFYQLVDLSLQKQKEMISSLLTLAHYDIILIDAGAGISQNVVSFVTASDDVIVVTTPEPTALTDAYGMIKVIAAKSNKYEVKIIVNMVQDEIQGLKVFQKLSSVCQRFLSFSLYNLGAVKDDLALKKAVQKQNPVVLETPNSFVSNNLKSVLARLESIEVESSEEKENSILNFLKKIFSIYQ